MFKRDDNKDFRLVQILTMGEAYFNRLIPLKNQLVTAAKNFGREEKLSPVLILTLSNDMDEQIKLSHKGIDEVDQANRKKRLTLLRYKVEKPESSNDQVQIFAKKKEEEKFQEVINVNYQFEELIYLLEVTDFLYDQVSTTKPICSVL